jgi:hypothetical protein
VPVAAGSRVVRRRTPAGHGKEPSGGVHSGGVRRQTGRKPRGNVP